MQKKISNKQAKKKDKTSREKKDERKRNRVEKYPYAGTSGSSRGKDTRTRG